MLRIDLQPAWILHARAYRETSLLLEVLSRDHGRLGVIARGVRGARGQASRAILQPLQPLLVSAAGRGELLQLRAAEVAGPAWELVGASLLSGFYINELLIRLLPRQDPQATVFWRYGDCLAALAEPGVSPAWNLRCFERDLLSALGYALRLDQEVEGAAAVESEHWYHYDPDAGPIRLVARQAGAVSGRALLALKGEAPPDAAVLRELRRLMRTVLLHRLGGRELRSWQVLADFNGLQAR